MRLPFSRGARARANACLAALGGARENARKSARKRACVAILVSCARAGTCVCGRCCPLCTRVVSFAREKGSHARTHMHTGRHSQLATHLQLTTHSQLATRNSDRKKPPPPGGVPIYYVPSSRTVNKRTPLEEFVSGASRGVLLVTVLDEGT